MHVHDCIPLLVCGLVNDSVPGKSCVIDDDVDLSVPEGSSGVDEGGDVGLREDVSRVGDGGAGVGRVDFGGDGGALDWGGVLVGVEHQVTSSRHVVIKNFVTDSSL